MISEAQPKVSGSALSTPSPADAWDVPTVLEDFRTTRPQLSQKRQLVLSKTPAAAAWVAPQLVDLVDLL